jgi:hypothetical protein
LRDRIGVEAGDALFEFLQFLGLAGSDLRCLVVDHIAISPTVNPSLPLDGFVSQEDEHGGRHLSDDRDLVEAVLPHHAEGLAGLRGARPEIEKHPPPVSQAPLAQRPLDV